MSALDVSKILVGGISTIEISAYVTAKGAGTFTDAGCTIDAFVHKEKVTKHMTEIQQRLGPVKGTIVKREIELTVHLAQAEIENLRIALGEPAGAVTGTPPNVTIKRNMSAVAQAHQIRVKTPGLGTTGVRTILYYNAQVKEFPDWTHKKDAEQMIPVTFEIIEETTGSGTDSWNAVEA
jgi:hypothetical protein